MIIVFTLTLQLFWNIWMSHRNKSYFKRNSY